MMTRTDPPPAATFASQQSANSHMAGRKMGSHSSVL